MPIAIAPNIQHDSWTREKVEALDRSTDAWDRHELLSGRWLQRPRKTWSYSLCETALFHWMLQRTGCTHTLIGCPIDVATQDNPGSEPRPTLIVLTRPVWGFKDANPSSQDIRLLVEISEPDREQLLEMKLPLYARAGIVDYWVIDVQKRRLIVHREPKADGSFGSVLSYREDEPVNPLAAPETEFRLADLYKEEA